MEKINRRKFIGKVCAAYLGVQILPARLLGKDGGIPPSEMLNFGIIGNGLISRGHRNYFSTSRETRVLALCDVHKGRLDKAKDEAEKRMKSRSDIPFEPVKTYVDYIDLLERDDIDAVVVSTPDHWHAAIAIKAIEMGKAVYVEKPMTLTIEEGQILSRVVRKCSGVLQVGSQQRSEWAFRRAAELVRNGYIGKVHTINTRIGRFPPEFGELPEEPIPEGFDYDKWLGPTPWYPYNSKRVESNYGGGWRCSYDYGARKEGDWGAHHFDIIQWALGMDNSGPTDFYPENSNGSKYRHYKYNNGPTVYVNAPTRDNQMIHFIGDEGELVVSRGGKIQTSKPELATRALRSSDIRLEVSDSHRKNFLDAIKYGKKNICTADIGHRSNTVCQLMSMARRLKKHVKWNPETEQIINNPEAEAMVSRTRRAPYYLGV